MFYPPAKFVCSCAERDGDAFPKAFERELVTPTNLQNVSIFLLQSQFIAMSIYYIKQSVKIIF